MSDARIRCWRNHYRSRQALPASRVQEWEASLGTFDIAPARAGLVDPDEWVLIRRLPLDVRCRLEDDALQVGVAWREALEQSLQQALSHGGANVVRYRDRRAALADLVYRAALGDVTRIWAWQRMGLIEPSVRSPVQLQGAALQALLAQPTAIWPLLLGLLRAEAATGAWSALMRALPAAAWRQLLLAAPQTRPFAAVGTDAPAAGEDIALDMTAADELLRWINARTLQAARQPDALAIMLAALVRPYLAPPVVPPAPAAVLSQVRQTLQELLASSVRRLSRQQTGAASIAAGQPQRWKTAMADSVATKTMAVAPPARTGLPLPAEAPSLPESAVWRPTEWGGLLFLLHLVPAHVPLDELAASALVPHFLWRLATRLGIPLSDPAVWAFCGGWQPGAAECNAAGAHWAVLDARAALVVADWDAWLAAHAADLPEPRLPALCLRPGRLRMEPGWIELHLPLDSADTRLRRLALDLDPGWLPWLGCVVRICYD